MTGNTPFIYFISKKTIGKFNTLSKFLTVVSTSYSIAWTFSLIVSFVLNCSIDYLCLLEVESRIERVLVKILANYYTFSN